MLLAKNGYGKTTLLECVHGLFGLMADPVAGRFASPGPGCAQLDVRATWTIDGRTQTVVLSVWTGTQTPLVVWSSDDLEAAQASFWGKLGLESTHSGVSLFDDTDDLGRRLHRTILEARGAAPETLFGNDQDMPTVLFFPADRRLARPEDTRRVERPDGFVYQPAHCFASDGPEWGTTIDNLLVWLQWLDDGRLNELLDFVNARLFEGESRKTIRVPQRQVLLTYVSTSAGDHPLTDLSHGERALLQLYVRIACNMTSNTIVLIDEVEMHLHSNWMFRMFEGLKSLLRKIPALSIVFTTHNRELIRVFDHQLKEEGLVKGGYLIEDGLDR
ncbi:MAG: AAA family ATPase [Bryobacterales bacterium]|nr:AAA family ATPase [Bryobacterales bacterium]